MGISVWFIGLFNCESWLHSCVGKEIGLGILSWNTDLEDCAESRLGCLRWGHISNCVWRVGTYVVVCSMTGVGVSWLSRGVAARISMPVAGCWSDCSAGCVVGGMRAIGADAVG